MRKDVASHRVDKSVWDKKTKGRAGIRWDDVIEKNMEIFREGARRGTVSC